MKLNFFENLLGRRKSRPKSTDQSSDMDDLLKQIMQPDIICDHCFFDGRQSHVKVEGIEIVCHTCHNKLEQIIVRDKGAQLAFYLPMHWSAEKKDQWVQSWKVKNFSG